MSLDLAALKNEILNDPNNYGYAALVAIGSDAGIASILNDSTKASLPKPVDSISLGKWAAKTGIRAKIKAGQANPTASVAALCDTVMDMLSHPAAPTFDPNDTDAGAIIQALITAGILTAADRTSLVTWLTKPASRAEVLFGPNTAITHTQVALALRG